MLEDSYRIIGLMSGTSLDGIDLVYVEFKKSNFQEFEILFSETISYSKIWRKRLEEAISFSKEKLIELDVLYGNFLGKVIKKFIQEKGIEKIDFIASHGHTILHQPDKGFTLQIGNGQIIANVTQQKVICDFRSQDVEYGGQGAPLVPIGDKLLFSNYEYCVNLGGFANVSFEKGNERLAFDICPVNIVLNYYTRKIGLEYDDGGHLASKGLINKELLEALNNLSFYKVVSPKSLGLEWVKEFIYPLIDKNEKDIPSILRTFIEHVAIQIGSIIKESSRTLFTGGGVFNAFLIEQIKFYTNQRVVLPKKELVDYKEALIFAFLGLLRVENQVNCLASVTGAAKDHSSGEIFYPNN
ncbi:anhydro-N-acetylmuramic acid kinase [Tenacibaculum sp. E3R01]|uniref:anhydro-N-acetylmuramic acid kinase n=1 Tax=Tenacibaculum sp. E3R01 TaxID=2267227 RepID=UPI000DEBAE69|nr:anhydro-N-acetylmuramic acid kinase [Tenacibaculum sp. E3R01]RBW54243.1 anhydro-N-acetylmuramic acid kinase [Tenacibaculum sp. E3R01]